MRILVMGSGGLGGYFGGLLAKAGQDVRFVARGERLRTLQERGLRIQSVHGDFAIDAVRAGESPAELGPADLVLFCVKTFDTQPSAEQLRGALAPGATVLTLQNGLGSAEQIDKVLGAGPGLPGAAHIESAIGDEGVIVQSSPRRRITFGELDGQRSARTGRILDVLLAAETDAVLSNNIRAVLWEKFLFITVMAGLTSVTRKTLGEVLGYEPTRALFHDALEEGAAVARAEAAGLSETVVQDVEQSTAMMAPAMRSSMQKDLERDHKIEVEALNGTLVRLGQKHGIATPVNAVLYAILALENLGR